MARGLGRITSYSLAFCALAAFAAPFSARAMPAAGDNPASGSSGWKNTTVLPLQSPWTGLDDSDVWAVPTVGHERLRVVLDQNDPWSGRRLAPSSRPPVELDLTDPWQRRSGVFKAPVSSRRGPGRVKLDTSSPWPAEDRPTAPPSTVDRELDQSVDAALAHALQKASDAGQWDLVRELARQLDERRKARAARPH